MDDQWCKEMTKDEAAFCDRKLYEEVVSGNFKYARGFLAARMWVNSRAKTLIFTWGTTGERYHRFVVRRWNWRKFRFDHYVMGFNHGGPKYAGRTL